MKRTDSSNCVSDQDRLSGQAGSAMVLALFVLALISVFVAYALTRSSAEAASIGNETSEARTQYAAQGSLEMMTRNFNKVFETKLNPTGLDISSVETAAVPGLNADYDFEQDLLKTASLDPKYLTGGPYSGLYAIRDTWQLRTTATSRADGTQVQMTRNILNNRIPIFQFGIFYDDDLELYRPPRFSFGGRVHSNRHFFISPGAEGVYFDSRVTAYGHIVTQSWRNWYTGDSGNNETWIKDASGTFRRLAPTSGSVLNGTPNVFGSTPFIDPDLPPSRLNPNWSTQSAVFDGNLQARTKQLKLPLKVSDPNSDLIDMVKRGKKAADANGGDLHLDATGNIVPVTAVTADNAIQTSERFANKTGIRISLADSKAKLPGCASGVGTNAVSAPCGVRLDGDLGGALDVVRTNSNIAARTRGYQPLPMNDGYTATRVNGERLHTGGFREVWIKVETVETNNVDGSIVTKDITQDILSLGVTEEFPSAMGTLSGYTGSRAADNNGTPTAPSANLTATTPQSPTTYPDSRSVIKIQRFAIPGVNFPKTPTTPYASFNSSSGGLNYVKRFSNADASKVAAGCPISGMVPLCTAGDMAAPLSVIGGAINSYENLAHLKLVGTEAIVPFPIKIFDSREGEYYDDAARYTAGRVTRNGVMSLIDIDVANLRRFLRGDFDGRFPTTTPFAASNGGVGLRKRDIPQTDGWVLYLSDRRGDADFDGDYDMEDIYANSPGNTGGLDPGEDVNKNGILEAKYIQPGSDSCVLGSLCEATKYAEDWYPDFAAVLDHKYYRRGIRLINGTTIPGIYTPNVNGCDTTSGPSPQGVCGFAVASENGVYVKGNYNATHVTSVPTNANTPYDEYRPMDSPVHIPASVIADSVTILSNNWKDAESLHAPYNKTTYRQATETTIRFAMISGDTIATRETTPHQGGISPKLNGGVHNFKRFLERWTGDVLSYSGSLINLFNSRNNNGSFKCCNTVYDPPRRNWVFDSTFLEPNRIPPGTPFFQYVQTTGFERATE